VDRLCSLNAENKRIVQKFNQNTCREQTIFGTKNGNVEIDHNKYDGGGGDVADLPCLEWGSVMGPWQYSKSFKRCKNYCHLIPSISLYFSLLVHIIPFITLGSWKCTIFEKSPVQISASDVHCCLLVCNSLDCLEMSSNYRI
jgi:hypothetical protein